MPGNPAMVGDSPFLEAQNRKGTEGGLAKLAISFDNQEYFDNTHTDSQACYRIRYRIEFWL